MEKTAIGLLSRVTAGVTSLFGGMNSLVTTTCKTVIENFVSTPSNTNCNYGGYCINNSMYNHTVKSSITGKQDSVYSAKYPKQKKQKDLVESSDKVLSDGDSVCSSDETINLSQTVRQEPVDLNTFRSLYVASQNLTLTGIDNSIYARDSNTKDAHHITQIFDSIEKIEKEKDELSRRSKLFKEFIMILKSMETKFGADMRLHSLFMKAGLTPIIKKRVSNDDDESDTDGSDEYEIVEEQLKGSKLDFVSMYGPNVVELRRLFYEMIRDKKNCLDTTCHIRSFLLKLSDVKNSIDSKLDNVTNYYESYIDSNMALLKHYYIPCFSFWYDSSAHNILTNIFNCFICKLRGKDINTPVYYSHGVFRNAAYMCLELFRKDNLPITCDVFEVNLINENDWKDINDLPLGQSNGFYTHVSGLDLITLIKYLRENIRNIGPLDDLPKLFGRFRSNITDYSSCFVWALHYMNEIGVIPSCELDFQ